MTDARTVRLEVAAGLATVTLDRPAHGNAIDEAVARDLRIVVDRLAADEGVRAVLLRGNGPMFTVGGDVELFARTDAGQLPGTLTRMVDDYHLALDRLSQLDAPVVAAVRGVAAGGGLGLVCLADVVVAADDAVFAIGHSALGLSSDGGISWALPRLIGLRRTQEMYLLGRRLTAAEALELGLVTTVVGTDDVEAEARRVAERLAAGPTRAYGAIRRLLRSGAENGLRDQLAAENASIAATAATDDAREGIAAFAGRRRADFSGR